jgi:Mrp family chromosome partitioning ATPase
MSDRDPIEPVGDSTHQGAHSGTDDAGLDKDAKKKRPLLEKPSKPGVLPAISIQHIRKMADIAPLTEDELAHKKIISPKMQARNVLNTFRELRTRLVQMSNKKNFVAMVTPVCSQGGGSFTSLNLAAAFALDQTKTAMLIDCNLYDPFMDDFLPTETDYGLTDYLVDPDVRIEDIIYASGVPRVRMVPLGKHVDSAAEYFSSDKMARFIADVKERYPDRFIFLDAPPAATTAEARILAELSDFVVLVVPYGKVTQGQVKISVEAVGKEKLAGVIFNN